MTYDFPGNVRELENLLEHAFVMCKRSEITVEHLPREFREAVTGPKDDESVSMRNRFKRSEAAVIIEALKRNGGRRGETARELGIDPSTLWRKMKRLDIKQV
jgi:DNA-binding NtrC family response regulator